MTAVVEGLTNQEIDEALALTTLVRQLNPREALARRKNGRLTRIYKDDEGVVNFDTPPQDIHFYTVKVCDDGNVLEETKNKLLSRFGGISTKHGFPDVVYLSVYIPAVGYSEDGLIHPFPAESAIEAIPGVEKVIKTEIRREGLRWKYNNATGDLEYAASNEPWSV